MTGVEPPFAAKASPGTTRVVLVHGVGVHWPGTILGAAADNLRRAGVSHDRAEEYNWSERVPEPFDWEAGRLSLEYVAGLGSGFLGAARLPVLPGAKARGLRGRCLEWLGRCSEAVCVSMPVVAALAWVAYPACWSWSWSAVGLLALAQSLLALSFLRVDTIAGVVRRVLLLALWPWVFVSGLVGMLPWRLLTTVLFGLVGFVCGELLVDAFGFERVEVVAGQKAPTLAASMTTMFCTLAAGGLGWRLGPHAHRVLRFFLAPSLKVLADVFQYLGDEVYRERLVRGLHTCLVEQACDRLILGTHSLGTMISCDVLRARDPRLTARSIVWITAGSPLKWLVHRFFPLQYPRPERLHRELVADHADLTWINVFRPLDPIGRRLGLGRERDQSTRQWIGRFLVPPMHSNYWGDPRVFESVGAMLSSPGAVEHRPPPPGPTRHVPTWQVDERSRPLRWLRVLVPNCVIALLVWHAIRDPFVESFFVPERYAALRVHGRPAEAVAYHRTWTPLRSTPTMPRELLRLRFVPDGDDQAVDLSPDGLLVDLASLRDAVQSKGAEGRPFPGEPISTCLTVSVVHDAQTPTELLIEDHEWKRVPRALHVAAAILGLCWIAVHSALFALAWTQLLRRVWLAAFGHAGTDPRTIPGADHVAGFWRFAVGRAWGIAFCIVGGLVACVVFAASGSVF